jgi:hypothetical protein
MEQRQVVFFALLEGEVLFIRKKPLTVPISEI